MADYSPSLVTEQDVRNMFTPPLDYNDVTKAQILLYIETVEDYIKAVYFDDSMPSKSEARIPALLLVMSKIIKKPDLLKKYGVVEYMKLGDFTFRLEGPGRGKHVTAYEVAKSWEEMAHEMLKSRGKSQWAVYKAND